MSNALTPVLKAKKEHIARQKLIHSQGEIERAALTAPAPRGFVRALARAAAEKRFPLIAEMKRRSPSGGQIRPGFSPAAIARCYAEGGATCLSILTDEPFFGGNDADLVAARAAVPLPILRKDFMIDPYQIAESRALGADCILLIVAILDDAMLKTLKAEAERFGMDVLVEVHNEIELDRALALNAQTIGINNRDLKALKTDLATFERLAPRIPGDRLIVAESGLRVTGDLERMAKAGARGYLVGESLLRQPDLAGATRTLLGVA